jgi:hypothetical protein
VVLLAAAKEPRRAVATAALRLALLAPSLASPAAAAGAAPGDGAHFSLNWSRVRGAETCISAPDLARAVEVRLGRHVFVAPAETEVALEGYVGPGTDDGLFHAVVSLSDSTGGHAGTRELTSPTEHCRDLDAALVLAIALLIDPNASFDAPRAPAPPSAPPAPAVPEPAPAKAPAPAPAYSERPARFAVAAGPEIAFGTLPSTSVGAFARGYWKPSGFWLTSAGIHFLPDSTEAVDERTRVAFSAFSVEADLCPLSGWQSRFFFSLCGGVNAGVLNVNGNGREGLIVHHRLLLDAAARAGVSVAVSSTVGITLGSALEVALRRDSFVYLSQDDAHRPLFEPAVVHGVVDAGLIFWLP